MITSYGAKCTEEPWLEDCSSVEDTDSSCCVSEVRLWVSDCCN